MAEATWYREMYEATMLVDKYMHHLRDTPALAHEVDHLARLGLPCTLVVDTGVRAPSRTIGTQRGTTPLSIGQDQQWCLLCTN
ncbi:hypothetical protein SUGI_1146310 [Cryptomeria japonica]|nr:hypothetical protein SUGI_1146310 [Cryptomeria japonica]